MKKLPILDAVSEPAAQELAITVKAIAAGENYSVWDEDAAAAEGFPQKSELIHLPVQNLSVGERLDKWLAAQLGDYSRSRLQQWITDGHVRVNGKIATVRQTIWNDDEVEIQPQMSAEETAFQPEDLPLDILYEDEALLVLNKPAGLVVHPAAGNWSGTLLNGLLHHVPELSGLPRAGIVHRLDKETSGLMVVAKTLTSQTHLVRQLQARTVRREYLALVHGVPPDAGKVDAPIGRHPRDRVRMVAFKPVDSNAPRISAKPAVTHFQVIERQHLVQGDDRALVRCRLETGRTHQIRVHMQSIGFPLVGDPLYGKAGKPDALAQELGFTRQALHAWQLGLLHPVSGRARLWNVQPPEDFVRLLQTLGFHTPSLTSPT